MAFPHELASARGNSDLGADVVERGKDKKSVIDSREAKRSLPTSLITGLSPITTN